MKQGAIIEEIGGEPASGSEGTRFQTWHDTYSVLQWAEIESCLSAWVEAAKPAFGPEAAQTFDLVGSLDRRRVRPSAQRREEYSRRLKAFLGPNEICCACRRRRPWRCSRAP
jgi:hypothetical protein